MIDTKDPIKNVLFIKIGGVPLIYLKDLGEDTYLISGYLEAFKNFSSELENAGEIRSINLDKVTFSYFSNNPEFYIISINDSRIPINKLIKFLEQLHNSFIDKFSINEVKNWNKSVDYFQSFIPTLLEKIQEFTEKCELKSEAKIVDSLGLEPQVIFSNPEIYAILVTDSKNKDIRSYVNPSMDDFELQVFVASPYFNRILINFIPTLANVANMLLDSKGQYYILKSDRFYLGMKLKNNNYIGIIGANKEAIREIINKI